jgi:hypothetical protein
MPTKFILLLILSAFPVYLNAQTFKPLGILMPPKGYREARYGNHTLDGSDFIKIFDNRLYIKSYSDTSIHIYRITNKGFVYQNKVSAGEPVGSRWAENLGITSRFLVSTDRTGPGSRYVYEYDGTIYVYANDKGKWVLTQKLKSPNGKGDSFGDKIDVTDSIMTVNAPYAYVAKENVDDNADRSPMIYQLQKNGVWRYLGKIPKRYVGGNFKKVLTGADKEVFTIKDNKLNIITIGGSGQLTLKQQLLPYPGDGFNFIEALSGSYYVNVSSGYRGINVRDDVQVYKKANGKWAASQLIKLPIAKVNVHSVSVHGIYMAIGLSRPNVPEAGEPPAGRVLIYKLKPSGWEFLQEIRPADSYAGDRFGNFVLLKGKNLVIFSEVHFDYQNRKKALEAKKEFALAKKLKPHGDIYLYTMK